jgi:hypothetical protein
MLNEMHQALNIEHSPPGPPARRPLLLFSFPALAPSNRFVIFAVRKIGALRRKRYICSVKD